MEIADLNRKKEQLQPKAQKLLESYQRTQWHLRQVGTTGTNKTFRNTPIVPSVLEFLKKNHLGRGQKNQQK